MGFDVYDFSKKYYPEEKLVLYGRSMGSGIASKIATQRNPGLVILETPYVDTKKLVDFHAPRFTPTSLILSLRLSNKANIPQIKCPVIIFHGTEDEIVPYEQAEELTTVLKDSDTLITIKNGNHRNLNDYPLYHKELKRALDMVK
jgi:alpha-beta hydrolase superfamily lysophospholipase